MTQKSFPGELADSESDVKKAILQKGKDGHICGGGVAPAPECELSTSVCT